jgi:hypothetical protein
MRADGILSALSTALFVVNLGVTVALLAVTILAGKRARRRLHYAAAVLTLIALAAAIVQAELYGRDYDFPALRLRVHLACAFASLACIPWVVVTGLRLRVRPHARPGHQRAVAAFVVLTAAAILTAVWMLLAATPIA